ncbi:MAG: hypothetical protein SPE03_05540 [Treponema sp.]|nr:hypothetical protein [Treponema sp.]
MFTRKTKIVCSIGPACDDDETIRIKQGQTSLAPLQSFIKQGQTSLAILCGFPLGIFQKTKNAFYKT